MKSSKDEIGEKMIQTDRHERVDHRHTKTRSKFIPGLLKVVDLRPQSDGHRVSGPRVIFLHDDVWMPVRRIDHTEENRESGLLDITGVFDTVDGRGPINARAPRLVELHDRVRGVEPSVANKRKKKSGLANLEQRHERKKARSD